MQTSDRDWWSWELTGIATSALSFGAMIAVLLYYDDKPGPKWQFGITVNSILSWTSTIAKSAMLIPISDGLSQMKWIWFTERDRDLADMDYFDEASRGPYGSLLLLLRLKARHLGALGALVMLAALAFDPTVQQLVQHPTRTVVAPNKTAIVSASELYRDYEPGPVLSCELSNLLFLVLCADISIKAKTAPLSMKAATYSGLLSQYSPTDPNVICPSGDCIWPDYSSLAVCSACQDVTSSLQVNCTESCEASLPGGAFLSDNSSVMSTEVNFTPVFYTNFSDQAHTLGGFQGIAAFGKLSPTSASDITATDCMLYMCVHGYHSTVYNGTYREDTPKAWPDIYNKTDDIRPETDSGEPYERYCNISGTKYGINGWTFTALVDHLQGDLLQGSITTRNWEYDFSSDVMQAIWGFGSFTDPINRLAAGMTKVVHDGGNQSEAFIEGKVWQPEVYISVHWKWLIFPLSLFVLTIV
jgi:hypothetical protein